MLTFFRTFEMILVAPCRSLVRIVELCSAISGAGTSQLRVCSRGPRHGFSAVPVQCTVEALKCAPLVLLVCSTHNQLVSTNSVARGLAADPAY